MTDDELAAALSNVWARIDELHGRLDELEARTSLTSPSFLKRSFAVLGHYLVASLLIALPIYGLVFLLYLLGAVASR